MKGKTLAIAAAAVALLGGSAVYAAYGSGPASATNPDSSGYYQQDTTGLRGDLAARQQDLRQEYDRANPDSGRIAALQDEIHDLRAQMRNADYSYGPRGMSGYGMRHHGMMWRDGNYGTCGCW